MSWHVDISQLVRDSFPLVAFRSTEGRYSGTHVRGAKGDLKQIAIKQQGKSKGQYFTVIGNGL
jgi:hypothetical protein